MKIIDKIAYIYIKDKKILATLSKGKDTYYMPGGKREDNETYIERLNEAIENEETLSVPIKSVKIELKKAESLQ